MGKLKAVLLALMLGALIWACTKYLDARLMISLFRSLTLREVSVLAVVPLGFLLPRSARFALLLVPKSTRRLRTAIYTYCASQAVSLLPGGLAGRAAVMKSGGLPFRRNLLPVVTDAFFDHSFMALATLLLAASEPRFRVAAYVTVPALVCTVWCVLLPPFRLRFKRASFAVARRWGKLSAWRIALRSFQRMWGFRRFLGCWLCTVVANLASLFALWWAVRALSLEVPLTVLMLAWLVPNLLGRLSLLPGGAGIVETGMVAIMVRSGGLSPSQAATATVLFRITDTLLPALYGLLLYLPMAASNKSTTADAPAPTQDGVASEWPTTPR